MQPQIFRNALDGRENAHLRNNAKIMEKIKAELVKNVRAAG